MAQMLMKVQVGPVQEFIAQARSTRDLWAGSYLLSRLTARAMEVFEKNNECSFIFPRPTGQPLYEMVVNNHPSPDGLIPTLPNVFMLLVPKDQCRELATRAEAAVLAELKCLGDRCWAWMEKNGAEKTDKTRWDAQLESFPQLTWHAIDYDATKSWGDQVGLLGQQLAARRYTRNFKQWGLLENEKGNLQPDASLQGLEKDILSGKEEIIGNKNFWDKIKQDPKTKKAGPLGAMNLVKRLFVTEVVEKEFGNLKSFWENMRMDSTHDLADRNSPEKGFNPYMAVLAFDGDRMGAALKKLEKQEDQTAFSTQLATFAQEHVKKLVEEYKGQLIYAGGDDVLALCPADQALQLAKSLRDKFMVVMEDYKMLDPSNPLDASCGIAVAHHQFPLQRAVQEAHAAEKRAKNQRDRGAFSMSLLKRSGEIIHWGGKWDHKALEVYLDFTKQVEEKNFSGRFAYALAELLAPYRLDEGPSESINLKDIIKKEFQHVQQQQALHKKATVSEAETYLDELSDQQLTDFPNLFLASAFMNRQRGER